MISLLLAFALLFQGGIRTEAETGTLSGTLKTANGTPAIGVRVSAMALPDSTLDAQNGAALVSLAETDVDGHYRLEGIPPGRYYVTAGRVDAPTYFPGTRDVSTGTIISVASKATIAGMDFTLQDASVAYVGTASANVRAPLAVPVQVSVENGARQPVSANGYYVVLGLTRTADGARNDFLLSSNRITAPLPLPVIGAEYRITVDNLPEGYALKSIRYGTTDLMKETLKLNAANFAQFTSPVEVTLTTVPVPPPPAKGVRVSGTAPVRGGWTVYRGDAPGIFYADGTFELRDVPPGRHVIILQEAVSIPRFLAAIVTATDRDLEGVTLDEAGVLPGKMVPPPAAPADAVGSFHPLAGIHGRVLEGESGQPLSRGVITIMGRTMLTVPISSSGQFDFPHMLPGSYELRIETFEHFTLNEFVVVGEEDVRRDFVVRSSQEPAVPAQPEN